MLYLSYTFHLYKHEHIKPIRQAITAHLVDHPLYIFPMGKELILRFESNETDYYMEKKIAETFPEYEFVETLTDGAEELLLAITKIQEPHSGDDWGRRWNEDSLISEKYLVKRRERKPSPLPETKFYAFFGEVIQEYQVHIGVYDKGTPEQAFVVVDAPFGGDKQPNAISDAFKDEAQVIWEAIRLKEVQVDKDFAMYQENHRKKRVRKKKP